MGVFTHHEPCPACGSRNNLARYEDGSAFCFGCSHHEKGGDSVTDVTQEVTTRKAPLLTGEPQALRKRGLDEATCRKFRYLVGHDGVEGVQLATYCDSAGRPVAQKLRTSDKRMRWVGDPSKAVLFGQHLYSGGGRRVIITEGEIDAMSVSQALQLKWPVVSIPNGAQGALRDLEKQVEWLDTFKEVVLMFDMDDAGVAAAAEVAEKLRVSPGKVRIAKLPLKDANEMLIARRSAEIVRASWDATPYRPDGVVNGQDLWETVTAKLEHGLAYPWAQLDKLTHGQRKRELVVWTAGTGIGKSQFVREVAHDLVSRHGQKVGIISLEESNRESALGQMSLVAGTRLHIPEEREKVEDEVFKKAFDETLGTGRYEFYDHFGSIEADEIIPKIRYMVVACGCQWIVLDHISIMVSGNATEGDERKRIDELMTRLRSLTEELQIGMHVVSHVRKALGTAFEQGGQISLDDLRGSGSIKQVANMVIAVERNQQAKGETRNRSNLRVLKNRFSGETGPAGAARYTDAGRLEEAEAAVFEEKGAPEKPAPVSSDDAGAARRDF